MASQHLSSSFKVYVRRRPLITSESSASKMERSIVQHETNQSISLSSQSSSNRSRTWKSVASFAQVFVASAVNSHVFERVVAPTFPQVMDGATCNFFAYGHSGSGKTHTIVGYDYEDDQHLGMWLSAARDLFRAVDEINVKTRPRECSHGFSEPDGQTHIRGQTEILESGKVRLRKTVLAGLEMRKTGSSSVHDKSSRTHVVLELEVINKELLEARCNIYLEEHKKSLIRTPEGQFIYDPERPLNKRRIDAAEAEKREDETRLKVAEDAVAECFKTRRYPCLGGKFVFVDLAGSDHFDQGNGTSVVGPKQTSQERLQGRQINTDLFALKEVVRARALNQARIPFRSSPLTMVLRSHFLATNKGQSAMILTVSPSEAQFTATMNTLQYGNLVGIAGETTQK
ncbi:kinesin family protein [Lepidopterella palustris CBS 459.81]|uniref:Kinesin family protein n=1 Tax=Lepidopterella palustris CBS 459.81 TaxID=1314670 RepID=A0A8E2J9P7_9PEZI|nr:kinesin family protein [Lepidopterella palustris CBS 459.81]